MDIGLQGPRQPAELPAEWSGAERSGAELIPAEPSGSGPFCSVGTQTTSPTGPKSRAKPAPGNHHQPASSLHVVLRLVATKRSEAPETQ